jgi:hypothetical protein
MALATVALLGAGIGVLALSWSISHPSKRPPSAPAPAAAGPRPSEQPGQPRQLSIWLTGYSWQDNTPPGSSKVGEPVLHQVAGGTGTFADPITVATPGHQGDQAWKPGTKFYLPTVQRYVIVEDSGAAEAPEGTDTHLDMWIGGQDGTKSATDDCENQFTGKVPAQLNPPDGLPVMAGPIYANQKCAIPPQPADKGSYQDPGDDDNDNDDGDSGHHSDHHHGHHGHHSDDDDNNNDNNDNNDN